MAKNPQIMPKRRVTFNNVPSHSISGFFGGINPNEGNISFFQDNLIPKEGEIPGQIILDIIEHNFLLNIRMTPVVWKRMALWMTEHIKRYEAQHGEISLVPQNSKKPEKDQHFYS